MTQTRSDTILILQPKADSEPWIPFPLMLSQAQFPGSSLRGEAASRSVPAGGYQCRGVRSPQGKPRDGEGRRVLTGPGGHREEEGTVELFLEPGWPSVPFCRAAEQINICSSAHFK